MHYICKFSYWFVCLNKPEIVWEFQKKTSKNSEKIQMRKTSQSAIKTQKYLLKKGTHSVVANCHWPQIHMSNWIIEFAASAKFRIFVITNFCQHLLRSAMCECKCTKCHKLI